MILHKCPECHGVKAESVCPLCEGHGEVSEQILQRYLKNMIWSKGDLVTVSQFASQYYVDKKLLATLTPPQKEALKVHLFIDNLSPKAPFMVCGYVYHHLGTWTKNIGTDHFYLTNVQKVRVYKLTPFLTKLAQSFYALPQDMALYKRDER